MFSIYGNHKISNKQKSKKVLLLCFVTFVTFVFYAHPCENVRTLCLRSFNQSQRRHDQPYQCQTHTFKQVGMPSQARARLFKVGKGVSNPEIIKENRQMKLFTKTNAISQHHNNLDINSHKKSFPVSFEFKIRKKSYKKS